jgi:hypothetical protein
MNLKHTTDGGGEIVLVTTRLGEKLELHGFVSTLVP